MPKDFEACARAGGKVITQKLKGSRYVHLCKDKAGKWHRGYVKEVKNRYSQGLKGEKG